MAGLTADGLTIKRLPEVLQDIVTKERELINSGIITSDDSIIGQLNSIIGASVSQMWELGQAVNDNFNKNKAEGKNLDDLGDIIGVYRITESNTFGDVLFEVKDGTTLNVGLEVISPTTSYTFEVTTAQTISATDCLKALFRVATVSNSTAYLVSVDGTDYTYTSDSDTSALEISTGLKALIDADTAATWTATLVGNDIQIASDTTDNIVIVVTPYLGVSKVWKDIRVTATESGPIVAPANTVNSLVTANTNIFSVNNTTDFSPGRLEETDEEYRKRFSISSANGKATISAITDNLVLVDGVSYVKVYENETMVTDVDSRPAKSFEAIVLGGEDVDVATVVWDTKPAGIEMYGNTTEIIDDQYTISRTVKFTRPVAINMAVRVTYTVYSEEVFPTNGEDLVIAAVLDYINNLEVNTDVIPTRLFGPIYSAVNGIDSLVVEVQEITTPGDTPVELDYQETRYAIGVREYAQTTSADVYIVAV